MARKLKRSQIAALAKQPGIRAHRNSLRYKMKVKKGDTVQVIAGSDKGTVSEILFTLPARNMVVVDGVNIRTRHIKPQREGESGRIETSEAPIHVSNVMAYSKKEEVASKIAYTFTPEGRKVRMLKKTGEILD
ncbi:50S ribosomal protein L24 [Synechococcus sp. PCC 7336]|uniref:50S ribosomal protein L24 n=1 Tax=Synechococcus sp. PCC 7336 TaxID=195250 RepID=UPI00034BB8A8|nr:50S ribosomal protein L24 [Synechococcus sp. PCC 7336]